MTLTISLSDLNKTLARAKADLSLAQKANDQPAVAALEAEIKALAAEIAESETDLDEDFGACGRQAAPRRSTRHSSED